MPWGQDPLILVAPPWLQSHVGDDSDIPLLQADLRVLQVRAKASYKFVHEAVINY